MRVPRVLVTAATLMGLTAVTACGSSSDDSGNGSDTGNGSDNAASEDSGQFPITIEHALGTTVVESAPERVATVNWANDEVPLALGVVPVGMAKANFGDDDGDGILPWTKERLDELDAEAPVLFDETDGIDFEAVADTSPDVILAAYSGLTADDYETLSEIAPVVAYPETAWGTSWRDTITLNSTAMGMAEEGEQLIADLELQIEETVADYPELEGKSAMFMTHVDPGDVSEIGFYTAHDTRSQFFEDLGLTVPGSIAELSAETDQFALRQSAERIDVFDDVDIITGYGDEEGELLQTLIDDPLVSKIPAIGRGSAYLLPGSTPLATAANPTPLSLSWVLEDYVKALAEAAGKVE